VVLAELDIAGLEETRRNIPTAQQKRLDLYTTCSEVTKK
jgi:predicted amidohydrolase